MAIALHNMNLNVFKVKGSSIEFQFTDVGNANVAMGLIVSDGTLFYYPAGRGKVQIDSTSLPAGDHECVFTFLAVGFGALGRSYDSTVSIGGRKAVSVKGSIANTQKYEQDLATFVLRVS